MPDAPYREIPLRRRDGTIRGHALVDAQDYERLRHRRWSLTGAGYVLGSGPRRILLHRAVLGVEDEPTTVVDHINGDPLDFRRANLRCGGVSHNGQNRIGLAANNTSGFRGVTWSKGAQKWMAQEQLDGHNHYLGLFPHAEEAAHAAAAWRAEHMPCAPD